MIDSRSKKRIALWILAVIVVFTVLFIVGWKVFYGIVVPAAQNPAAFSTIGLLVFAAIAGILVNFGPCSLAVLPAYLSYLLGLSGEDKKLKHPLVYGLKTGFTAAVGVVGFYLALGVAMAGIGTKLAGYSAELKLVAAFLILILGIVLLLDRSVTVGVIDKFRRYVDKLMSGKSRTKGLMGFGVIYGAGGLSCFLPVFLPLVFFPFVSGAFGISLVSFLVFSLTQALFLVGATVAVAYGKKGLLRNLAGKTDLMKKIAGWVLVFAALGLLGVFIYLGM